MDLLPEMEISSKNNGGLSLWGKKNWIAFYLRTTGAIDGIVPIILPECQYGVIPIELENISCFNLKEDMEKYVEKVFRIPIS